MPTWLWVLLGCWTVGITASAAWVIWVLRGEAEQRKAWRAQRAASEQPAGDLRHLRLLEGAMCMRCKRRPADDVDGIHCKQCAGEVRDQ
jgi:hypothetical protein